MKMKAADRKMANDLLKAYRDNLAEEQRIRKEMTAKLSDLVLQRTRIYKKYRALVPNDDAL